MANQGIKSYGTYFNASISDGSNTYINLSKNFDNLHFIIPLYNSPYKLSPINLSLIYTSSSNEVDCNFKTGCKLSIMKELSYDSQNDKYVVTNADMSTEDYINQNNRYENIDLASYMVIENNQKKIVYIDSVYTFDSSYKLILIEDRNNTINKIHFSYDEDYIESIYNNYGEAIDFMPMIYGALEATIRKDYVNVRKVIITFSSNYINNINYYIINNGTNNLVNNIQLSFDPVYQMYNTITKERILVEHPTNGTYTVYEGRGTNDNTFDVTSINLINNYHTVVSYNNMHTHYYFDDNYLINHIIDTNKYIAGQRFDSRKNIIFKSNAFKNNYLHQTEINNLISDGFCQGSTPSWQSDNANVSYINNADANYYYNNEYVTSSKLLKIQNNSIPFVSSTYQIINVSGTPLDTYVFRCLTKCEVEGTSATVKISLLKGNNEWITYSKALPSNTDYKELFFFEINPEVGFDKIKVLFFIKGSGATYTFDSICLTKQIAGFAYTYDNNNNITNILVGKNETKYLINENNKVISAFGKYNITHYDYNYIATRDNNLVSDDLIEEQAGLFGNKTNYQYNNYNEVTNEVLTSHEYDASVFKDRKIYLRKEYEYESNGEFISREKVEDYQIEYESNGTKHYLVERKVLPDGSQYFYSYNQKNLLNSVVIKDDNDVLKDQNLISYGSNLAVDVLTDRRDNEVQSVYNNDNRLSSVRLIYDDTYQIIYKSLINIKYVNEDSSSLPHLSLIKSKEYGDNGDKYIFDYDNKYNLSTVKYRDHGTSTDISKFSFLYDAYNRLKEIHNNTNDSTINLAYDEEDNLCEIESNEIVSNMLRDNTNSIIRLYNLIFNDSNETFQAFTDSKESNVFAPEHYYEKIRLARSNDHNANYSCFFDLESSNLVYKGDNGGIDEDVITSNVNPLIVSEHCVSIIKLISTQTRLTYDITNKQINGVTVFSKIKAGGIIASFKSSSDINLYVTYNSSTHYISCNYGNNQLINEYIELDTNKIYAISLVLDSNTLHLLINNKDYNCSVSNVTFKKLSIGCTSDNQTYGANLYVYGIIAHRGINFNGVYELSYFGLNYVFGNIEYDGNYTFTGFTSTTLFNQSLLDNYKVLPLFNDFKTLPNMHTLQVDLIDVTKDNNELIDNSFIYNKKSHRCNLYVNKNKVIYQTGLTNSGTILLRFTINENNINEAESKTLFRLFADNQAIKLSIINNKLYLNNNLISNSLVINNDVNTLAFSYYYNNGTFNYRVVLNNNYIDDYALSINLDSNYLKLQLGNTNDLSEPLDGFIEMLCIDRTYKSISSLQNDMMFLNHSLLENKYDSLNRLSKRNIIHDDNLIICNTYNYKKTSYAYDYNGTSKVENEIISYLNNNMTLEYIYDSMNRIKKIKRNNNIIKQYEYNALGYLTHDKNLEQNSAQERVYTYDNSGNILKREIKVNDVVVNTRNYKYEDNLNKNALTRITDENNNDIEIITYDSYTNSLPSTINNTNLTWEGMKLKSYGTISYDYDHLGRRIKKVTDDKSFKYVYDIKGNLVGEKITNLNNNSFYIVKYLYDKDNNVYGFIYNGSTYCYIKDILGVIKYISNSIGNIVLEYTYDAYGNIIDVNHLPGVNLSNINHIIYKSYYIDYENNLYYLKTRYYNPNWGRFISYDSVDYLNANIASGLNLYAYCLNDPVNGCDPEGTFDWGKFWTIVMYIGAVLADPIATMIGAVASTTSDIIAMGNINEEDDIIVKDGNVTLKDSSKIHTPWIKYGYSIYLNYFKEKTRDIIDGSSIGVEFEWLCHNIAYALTKNPRFKDLDVGHTIYNDIIGRTEIDEIVCSAGMQLLYWNFNPFAATQDFYNFIGGYPWQLRKRFTL
ncbi:MAG: RHS repeat-associated core domain-containing protein [Bacilli bacterium]|nr:RHS repeat-associated core domain-containing protein [Bacilli bacterium]